MFNRRKKQKKYNLTLLRDIETNLSLNKGSYILIWEGFANFRYCMTKMRDGSNSLDLKVKKLFEFVLTIKLYVEIKLVKLKIAS